MSRRWGWAVPAAGASALVVGIAVLVTARQLPPSFSTSPAITVATTTSVRPSGTAATSAAVPLTSAARPFRPETLTLSAFGVTAPVDPVFTTAGVLAPPGDPGRIGWWGAGALAGASVGTTVVVGHVDGPRGPGALYRLVHAKRGDRITVAGTNGLAATYAVTSLQYHGKGEPLPAALFVTDGPARLIIISCGGTFDRSDDEYTDNVVVQAVPV